MQEQIAGVGDLDESTFSMVDGVRILKWAQEKMERKELETVSTDSSWGEFCCRGEQQQQKRN